MIIVIPDDQWALARKILLHEYVTVPRTTDAKEVREHYCRKQVALAQLRAILFPKEGK